MKLGGPISGRLNKSPRAAVRKKSTAAPTTMDFIINIAGLFKGSGGGLKSSFKNERQNSIRRHSNVASS